MNESKFFPFRKSPDHSVTSVTYSINPEIFRIIAYVAFWIMVGISSILTLIFVPHETIEHSPIVQTFGYNTLCILFDYPPGNYVATVIYSFVGLSLDVYIFLIWIRTVKAYQQKIVTYKFMLFATIASVFELFLLSAFPLVFVIPPYKSMIGHTIPFMGFELFLVLNAMHNLLFYRKVLIFPPMLLNAGFVYVITFILATLLKIGVQTSVLFVLPVDIPIAFMKWLDRFWFLLASIIPLCLAIYFRKKVYPIKWTFDV